MTKTFLCSAFPNLAVLVSQERRIHGKANGASLLFVLETFEESKCSYLSLYW